MHSEEDMRIAAGDFHGTEFGFEAVDNGLDNSRVAVRNFCVVNVPADSTLRAFDEAVGNALVVRVNGETHLLKGGTE